MLLVTLRSAAVDQVPKVLQIVEQTKRIRHKAGGFYAQVNIRAVSDRSLGLETELHQYVLYDTVVQQKGSKRIVLDDVSKAKAKYTPPNSLIVHLSKIDIPELQPKANGSDKLPKKEDKKGRRK